jgi:integrase
LAGAIDPATRLAAYGGLRAGELFGLRAKRVDPLRRTVTIAETLVDVGGHPYFGPPKTRAGYRTIPLPRVAADPLAAHLTAYGRKPDDVATSVAEPTKSWNETSGRGHLVRSSSCGLTAQRGCGDLGPRLAVTTANTITWLAVIEAGPDPKRPPWRPDQA